MSDTKLMQIALLLKAIEDEENAFASTRTEHKDTLEKLHNELRKWKYAVLTGQQILPIEGVMEAVAAEINAGALNTPNITVTSEFTKKNGKQS